MIKVIIVDDEKNHSDVLNDLLMELCKDSIDVVAKCKTIKSAINIIKVHHPDLVFLNIEMSPENGFSVLEQMGEKSFEVIFTTGLDQCAIKTIRFAALDYLIKPFSMKELAESLNRYDKKMINQKTQKHYEVLLNNIKSVSDSNKKIALPTSTGFEFVRLGDIIRCESNNNYTQFYFVDKTKILVCKPLKDYTDLLEENGFFRIHQSHLINNCFIKRYSGVDGNTVMMTDGSEVEVSRRKRDPFIKSLMNGLK